MKRTRHGKELASLLIGAVLTGLTLVFPVIGFLEWITMVPLIWGAYRLADDESLRLRQAYGFGFLTVLAYYLVLYHWFVRLYPLDFVGLSNSASAVVVVVGWLGLSLLQALPGGLIFLAMRAIAKTGILRRLPLLRPFVFASLWVIFEWSSTLTWTGVPWGRLALGQVNLLPMLQSAALLGSYFISFLILCVNGLIAYALLYRTREILCGALAAGLLLSNLSYGLIASSIPTETKSNVKVAVIQGNINSHEKWSGDSLSRIRTVYADLTRRAAEEGAKLVLWPETVLPFSLEHRSDMKNFLASLAQECDVTLVVGSFYRETVEKEYNVLYLVDPDGTIRDECYAKRHLVPFGEYVPMEKLIKALIPPLAALSDLGGSLTAGEGSELFETEHGTLGSLICFDSIYEQLTLESTRDGAELFLVSSNDSWFYDSIAVYQHEAQSRLRAIESGRYFVRSANTGISSVIAPDGSHLAWIDPLETGYAVAEVGMTDRTTPYTAVGNLLVYLCIAFLGGVAGCGIYLKKSKKTDSDTRATGENSDICR